MEVLETMTHHKPPNFCDGVLYRVQERDTLFLIAREFCISLEDLIVANPQIADPDLIFPGQIICIPLPPPECPEGFLYTVQPTDTLSSIARAFSLSLQEIIDANPQIPDPNLIAIGQPICIPIPPPPETIIYSTGPLAIDPENQKYAGILVENNSPQKVQVILRVFNKDLCPKGLFFEQHVMVSPGCIISPAISIRPIFFYEVQIEVPQDKEIKLSVYGLTPDFVPLPSNTLRHTELTTLSIPSPVPTSQWEMSREETPGGAWEIQ